MNDDKTPDAPTQDDDLAFMRRHNVTISSFVHDEYTIEGPEDTAHVWAPEAARIMADALARQADDLGLRLDGAGQQPLQPLEMSVCASYLWGD